MRARWTVGACLIAIGCLQAASPLQGQAPAGHINDLVPLLERGVATFGPFVYVRTIEGGAELMSAPNPDFAVIDTEHEPFDVNQIKAFIQGTIDPAAVLRRGRPGTSRPVLVRIPAYGREMNQWMAKQVLDTGAYGVMFPHIETVEQALNAVRSMRFAHQPGAPDYEPNGQRGQGTGWPARSWGLSWAEYEAKADLWPRDPNGGLISVLQIENDLGVKNVRDIVKQVKGISVIFLGPNDLGLWYGRNAEVTEAGIQRVLAVCKESNVPCGITASQRDVEQRVKEGFRFIIAFGAAIDIGKKAAGR